MLCSANASVLSDCGPNSYGKKVESIRLNIFPQRQAVIPFAALNRS